MIQIKGKTVTSFHEYKDFVILHFSDGSKLEILATNGKPEANIKVEYAEQPPAKYYRQKGCSNRRFGIPMFENGQWYTFCENGSKNHIPELRGNYDRYWEWIERGEWIETTPEEAFAK